MFLPRKVVKRSARQFFYKAFTEKWYSNAPKKRIAIVKKRKTKVGTSFDPGVLEAFKAKAERVGIPYQTLLNSVVKRYTESKLDIEVA